jgi:putative hemolysin
VKKSAKKEELEMLRARTELEPQIENPQLVYSFARHPSEVAEAQRLRYRVFAEEMGARLSGDNGRDIDGFDAMCDHLLVRDVDTGEVVGTYRILEPHMAAEAGGYYSAGEFDLTRLLHLAPSMVEVGRSCVDARYRNGTTISLLWAGLAKYMMSRGYEHLIGCASISMADGGYNAAAVYQRLAERYMSPNEYRVFPHTPLPLQALSNANEAVMPPLIKGYMRLGAYICGEPAWDPDFNSADLLVMLPISRLTKRYADHFMK